MKFIFPSLFVLVAATSAHAQSPFYTLLGVRTGFTSAETQQFSETDWNALTPGSPGISDPSYDFRTNYGTSVSGMTELSLQAGLKKPLGNTHLHPVFGITFGSGTSVSAGQSWWRQTVTTYDTLTSSQTGEAYPLDSVAIDHYSKNYQSSNLHVGVRAMLQTNPARRWSLLFGLAVKYGFVTASSVEVWSSSDYYLEGYPDGTSSQYRNASFSNTRYAAPGGSQLLVAIPVELNLRIGNGGGFFSRTYIGVEGSVGYRITHIKGYGSTSFVPYSITAGLTYRFRGKPLVTAYTD